LQEGQTLPPASSTDAGSSSLENSKAKKEAQIRRRFTSGLATEAQLVASHKDVLMKMAEEYKLDITGNPNKKKLAHSLYNYVCHPVHSIFSE
jgi:hypothetical protein